MPRIAAGACWLAAVLVMCGGLPALADDTAPKPAPLPPQFQTVLAAKADCLEVTDQCMSCKKDGEGWACSTPGIACQPQPAICSAPKP